MAGKWIGEVAYQLVVEKYPTSDRAPMALYKRAIIIRKGGPAQAPKARALFQLIVDKVFSPADGLAIEEDAVLASVRLSAAYMNETIKPWILLIGGLRGDDTWLQSRVDYEPVDNWRFTLEADLFWGHAYDGDNGGVYGSFHANDLVGVSTRWTF